ncbi:MAG: transposase [Rhodocyclales bacterium]|nr:transposase [Rhodocyclales bacterium]
MGGVRTPYVLSDALWEQIEPLIPKRENTRPFGGGRPRRPDRQCMEAILSCSAPGVHGRRSMPRACAPARQRTTGFRNGSRRGYFDAFGKRAWRTTTS